MLRPSDPTKERAEPTTLGITAVEIPRSTKLTLLLRTRTYMWRNHVNTLASFSMLGF